MATDSDRIEIRIADLHLQAVLSEEGDLWTVDCRDLHSGDTSRVVLDHALMGQLLHMVMDDGYGYPRVREAYDAAEASHAGAFFRPFP